MRIKYRLPQIKFASLLRVYRHFGGLLATQRTRLILAAASMVGASLLTVARPWPIKIVLDYVLLRDKVSPKDLLAPLGTLDPLVTLGIAAFAVLALAGLRGVLSYSEAVLTKIVGHNIVASIRYRLFAHAQRLPLSYHDYRETGELMTRLTGDIALLEELLTSTTLSLGSEFLLIIGMFGVMFWLDWQLALATLAVTPLFLLAAFQFSVRIQKSARKQREMYGKIVASVQESLSGISQVKSFAQEKQREKLIGKSINRDTKANVKTARLEATYIRTVEIITAVGTCIVLWLGAVRVLDGFLSPGDLVIFLSYVRGVYRPVRNVARLSSRIAKATVRGEKIMEILELEAEDTDAEDALSADGVAGDFRFNGVDFSYTADRTVLRDVTCHIPAKRTTLIIGHTGAGKSTIAKMLLRLYPPKSGQITLDGQPLNDYRIRSLRKRVAPLTQETFLFRTTIAENIAFSRPTATREEIEAAARLVGADAFIQELPQGYDTLVGESGQTLSGGQRQRISFARAALRGAPVMIFDEPATGLDIHAEREAKQVLHTLRRDRTLILITHRLHFLDLADWVIFLENGTLSEEGAPTELLSRKGPFYHFVTHEKSEPANSDLEALVIPQPERRSS